MVFAGAHNKNFQIYQLELQCKEGFMKCLSGMKYLSGRPSYVAMQRKTSHFAGIDLRT